MIFFFRYLTLFEVYLTIVELTHPAAMDLIDSGILEAVCTLTPGSLCDIDKTMEETFMKFSKGSGTFVSNVLVMI